MSFTVEITGWTSQVGGSQLPICEISSDEEITKATVDFDAYSAETLIIHPKNGHHVSSFIFWQEARVHAVIGDITMIMVNLDTKVGVFLYSRTTGFLVSTLKSDSGDVIEVFAANDKKDIYHGFAVLEDSEKLQVKGGDTSE